MPLMLQTFSALMLVAAQSSMRASLRAPTLKAFRIQIKSLVSLLELGKLNLTMDQGSSNSLGQTLLQGQPASTFTSLLQETLIKPNWQNSWSQ